MSKMVFFNIPAHGHTNPTLGVVKEHISRGHEVWYYSYDLLRERIELCGEDGKHSVIISVGEQLGKDFSRIYRIIS